MFELNKENHERIKNDYEICTKVLSSVATIFSEMKNPPSPEMFMIAAIIECSRRLLIEQVEKNVYDDKDPNSGILQGDDLVRAILAYTKHIADVVDQPFGVPPNSISHVIKSYEDVDALVKKLSSSGMSRRDICGVIDPVWEAFYKKPYPK